MDTVALVFPVIGLGFQVKSGGGGCCSAADHGSERATANPSPAASPVADVTRSDGITGISASLSSPLTPDWQQEERARRRKNAEDGREQPEAGKRVSVTAARVAVHATPAAGKPRERERQARQPEHLSR